MNSFKPNGFQQSIMIITAGLLLYVSFNGDDVHIAKVLGIISAAAFLVYGIGQLSIQRPSFLTYQNIKRFLYCCLLITIGISSVVVSVQVYEAYKQVRL